MSLPSWQNDSFKREPFLREKEMKMERRRGEKDKTRKKKKGRIIKSNVHVYVERAEQKSFFKTAISIN